MIVEHEIIKVKTNHIPKGLAPLEIFFPNNDVCIKPSTKDSKERIVHCNFGTNDDPILVKLSKDLFEEKREKYIKLMKEYSDVFTWKYEDLKTYDKDSFSIIFHLSLIQ